MVHHPVRRQDLVVGGWQRDSVGFARRTARARRAIADPPGVQCRPDRALHPRAWSAAIVVSDVSANLAGTIAPPPGDVVVRLAQFRTWNVHPVDGMAGATLNMLIFYGARFVAPALGVAIFSLHAFDTGKLVTGLVSLIIAIVIVAVLVAVLQSDAVAESLARRAARAAGPSRRRSTSRSGWTPLSTSGSGSARP